MSTVHPPRIATFFYIATPLALFMNRTVACSVVVEDDAPVMPHHGSLKSAAAAVKTVSIPALWSDGL